jgi:hypothetical protein
MSENTLNPLVGPAVQPRISKKTGTHQPGKGKFFFVGMALLFPVITVIGFLPSYTAMNAGQFSIHWLAHVHGAMMAAWLLVYIAQAMLAAIGNFRFHKKLGLFSVGLGVLIWISMGVVSARALIGNPTPVDSFLFDILLVQLYIMQVFGIFFAWGILALVLMQAGLDRIPFLQSGVLAFIAMDILLLPLFIYDWITLKRIHKITWVGLIVYTSAQFLVFECFGSPAWHNFWFNLVNKFK